MRIRSILGTLALLAVLPGAAASHPAPPVDREGMRDPKALRPLSAHLECLDFYGSQEALNLRFSLTNHTDHTVWVLRWQMPSPEMDAPLFEVTRDGAPVAYEGPLVKRAQPDASDYVAIEAGATHTVVFDPSATYDMTLQGQYALRLRAQTLTVRHTAPEGRRPELEASLLVRHDQPEARPDTLPQDRLRLDGAPTATFAFQGVPGGSRKTFAEATIGGYNRCTTAQQANLQTAHANAITLTSKSYNHLTTNNSGSTLETRWFGAFTTSRHTALKDHYSKANAAFVNQPVVYDCACKKSYYAYVYPSQPYKIYLCRAFWSAPALGTDSKAGTLIHEMMHFTVVAGTQDYVYGTSGALNLALTDPDKAVMNSDNHEYFAENQP